MESAELIRATNIANVVRICQLIPTVATLYDHIISFDQEVELVWRKSPSRIKYLSLCNRYFGSSLLLINTIIIPSLRFSDDNLCRAWFIFQAVGTALIIWFMQFTMLFRTLAMYQGLWIRCIASCGLILEVVTMAAILIYACINLGVNSSLPNMTSSCSPFNIPTFIYAFWIPVITVDLFSFFLTLGSCILGRRSNKKYGMTYLTPIWDTLIRDSILHFLVSIPTYVINMVIWIILPSDWVNLSQTFSIAGTCITGMRMILDIRRVCYDSVSRSNGVATAFPGTVSFATIATQGGEIASKNFNMKY